MEAFGKTCRSLFGYGEVGMYGLKIEGKKLGDIEVQLNLMETGTSTVYLAWSIFTSSGIRARVHNSLVV